METHLLLYGPPQMQRGLLAIPSTHAATRPLFPLQPMGGSEGRQMGSGALPTCKHCCCIARPSPCHPCHPLPCSPWAAARGGRWPAAHCPPANTAAALRAPHLATLATRFPAAHGRQRGAADGDWHLRPRVLLRLPSGGGAGAKEVPHLPQGHAAAHHPQGVPELLVGPPNAAVLRCRGCSLHTAHCTMSPLL